MANYTDDKSDAQFLDGTSGDDTFIIDGLSSDYEYYKVLDVQGGTLMVVWRKDGSGRADVLNNIENIQFSDKTVTPQVTDNGSVYTTTSNDESNSSSNTSTTPSTDGTADHDMDLDEYIYDDADISEEIDGYGGHDSFVISASSSDYGWSVTEDGQGVVVWCPATGCFDILYNVEEIVFDDQTLLVSDIMNMSDSGDDNGSDDTPGHDVDLDEYIYDDADISEEINGYGGHDSFVISEHSSYYGWNPTEDGEGVVVWNYVTGCFDILHNVEEIIFDDQTLLVSDIMNMSDSGDNNGSDDTADHDLDLDEYIYDDYYISEEINGYGGHDSFVVAASSSLYGWDITEDGEGVVIWNEDTGCFDVLHNIEEIIFDDITLDISSGLGGGNDGGTGGSSSESEYIMDDAWASETIDGGAGEDTFVIDGYSDYFAWDWTDDGEGIVIWNEQTNAYDTLYNVEEIWFNDMSVWVDDLIGDDSGSGNGGSDNSGSSDDEYIMDDAWTSEIIDGGAGDDTFVIDGHSDDFMWDWTDDGQGIMIWNLYTDETDTLYNVEEISFSDTDVWVDDLSGNNGSGNGGSDNSGSSDDEYIMDDAWASEVIDGGAGDDTFVIDGHSDDFMWDWTDDGQGIMIWNLYTDETDTLYNVEEISFSDTDVWVDNLGGSSNTNSQTNNNSTNNNTHNNSTDNTNNNSTNTGADEYIIDDANASEVVDGGDGHDTFVIDGSSGGFMWDITDNGQGILIYNEATDTMDELYNIEEISFEDTTVLVDDLIG